MLIQNSRCRRAIALGWSVVQTHPNCSSLVTKHLKRQGFVYYNPKFSERVKLKNGGLAWRHTQLFANYVFVLVEDRWRALKSTVGVAQLLMQEPERPATIPDDFIAELKARENPSTGLIVLDKSKFNNGQSVQVKSGPFAYRTGLFDGKRDRDRVYVMLSLLGTTRRVTIKEDNLIAA